VVAFRMVLPGLDREQLNSLNRRLLETINSKRRVYLTVITIRGSFVLCICVLSFRTHMDRVEAALEDIRASVPETCHSLA